MYDPTRTLKATSTFVELTSSRDLWMVIFQVLAQLIYWNIYRMMEVGPGDRSYSMVFPVDSAVSDPAKDHMDPENHQVVAENQS